MNPRFVGPLRAGTSATSLPFASSKRLRVDYWSAVEFQIVPVRASREGAKTRSVTAPSSRPEGLDGGLSGS